ncbi:hypothetical protein G6F40_017211 [Rhizopus arrhizus]|nr:hypothetical protein G6F40_017211 [Rhizopus arrhizus]
MGLTIGCLTAPANAAALPPTTPAPSNTTDLDAVHVQAERYDARRDDTASRIVVDREALQRHGDTDLLEALKRLPGISVSNPAGRPAYARWLQPGLAGHRSDRAHRNPARAYC